MTVKEIRELPIFAGVTDRDLAWLLDRSRLVTVDPGDVVISRVVRPNHFVFLLVGRWSVFRFPQHPSEPLTIVEDRPGSWQGGGLDMLDVLAPCEVRVEVLSRLLLAPRTAINDLSLRAPALGRRLLAGLRTRVDQVADHVEAGRADRAVA
jgi:hypothetical protein